MTKHRDRDREIAQDVTDRLFAGVQLTSKPPSLAAFAHSFGAACKARNLVPDEAAYHRILFDVVREIGDRRQGADQLNSYIVKSTADLLERRNGGASRA